jgi:hypothetical protein
MGAPGLAPNSLALKPYMAETELACFERLLRCANRVLEYGCGGSTVFAASFRKCEVFSVESDANWLTEIEAEPIVRDAISTGRISLNYVNVGPTGEWGFPLDQECRHLWPRYSEVPWIRRSDFDLIFVDGRFRVACVLHAVLRAQPDALIVVHDFWDRPHYHVVLPFLEWKESSLTLGVFQKRRDIDKASVQALIDKYQYIAD